MHASICLVFSAVILPFLCASSGHLDKMPSKDVTKPKRESRGRKMSHDTLSSTKRRNASNSTPDKAHALLSRQSDQEAPPRKAHPRKAQDIKERTPRKNTLDARHRHLKMKAASSGSNNSPSNSSGSSSPSVSRPSSHRAVFSDDTSSDDDQAATPVAPRQKIDLQARVDSEFHDRIFNTRSAYYSKETEAAAPGPKLTKSKSKRRWLGKSKEKKPQATTSLKK